MLRELSRQTTKLVGESHPNSYLGFCVCSTNNATLVCPARWSWRSNKSASLVGTPAYLVHFSFNHAGKGRVFYSLDKCFETGADPRNIFDKQILKICRHFNAWFRAWLLRRVWELAPSPDFRNQLACGQKTIGSHLNCPRAYVITYTYQACGLLFVFTFFRLIRCLVDPAFMVSHFNTSLFAAV